MVAMLEQSHRPVCLIVAENPLLTAMFVDRLLSVEICDEPGFTSDSVTIVLDNRDGLVPLPRPQESLKISLGYGLSLVNRGTFIVGEVELTWGPDQLTITAEATDMSTIKTAKTRRWPDNKDKFILLGDVVKKIAGEHGLKHAISGKLKTLKIKASNQTSESDINFLSRIAKDYSALGKVANGKLLLLSKGEAKKANGELLGLIEIKRGQVSHPRMTGVGRNNYKSVEAFWRKMSDGTSGKEVAGKGDPVLQLRHTCKDKADAKQKAKARLDDMQQKKKMFSCEMPGDAAIFAETPVKLSGFHPEADIEWIVNTVRHSYSSSGFSTSIEASLPGFEKEPSKKKGKKTKKAKKKKSSGFESVANKRKGEA